MIEVRYSIIITANTDEEADLVIAAFRVASKSVHSGPPMVVSVREVSREEVR